MVNGGIGPGLDGELETYSLRRYFVAATDQSRDRNLIK
jgi:hypothetical protein